MFNGLNFGAGHREANRHEAEIIRFEQCPRMFCIDIWVSLITNSLQGHLCESGPACFSCQFGLYKSLVEGLGAPNERRQLFDGDDPVLILIDITVKLHELAGAHPSAVWSCAPYTKF